MRAVSAIAPTFDRFPPEGYRYRPKKTLIAAAFTVALGLGAATPALADSHMTGDTPVTTQDTHATVVTPQDENHAG
ncbi:hypothetical protein [Streptomyces sp. Ncost-T10-10d]|uniref:hypothetical protein n=1 Tax=Streptomyces sp. Ncost-T10-10d TaxID=1839774 RepID=UPI00081D49EE|nr:hypothetical protein [Streptomyces sp. Ncost-T10-10d]SCF60842.1 hypothetical protein GA0115254_106830 [Streptomyces sp. Ncost-T10-10d]